MTTKNSKTSRHLKLKVTNIINFQRRIFLRYHRTKNFKNIFVSYFKPSIHISYVNCGLVTINNKEQHSQDSDAEESAKIAGGILRLYIKEDFFNTFFDVIIKAGVTEFKVTKQVVR